MKLCAVRTIYHRGGPIYLPIIYTCMRPHNHEGAHAYWERKWCNEGEEFFQYEWTEQGGFAHGQTTKKIIPLKWQGFFYKQFFVRKL